MYVRQNVSRPQIGRSAGAAAPKNPNVVVVATDDILVWPTKNANGVLIQGNFVMKPGAKMIEVYMTPSKSKASYEPQGEEDSESYKHKFEGEHPGNELEIAEFVQNWTGVPAIVIYGSCSDDYRKVVGTKCAPVRLKATLQDDNDARKNMLVFEQYANTGDVLGHYTGEIITAEPFAVAGFAFAFDSANGYQYQLLPSAAADDITITANNYNHGDIITLIGGGGVDPTVVSVGPTAVGTFILKDGVDWVGLEGSILQLQVYKGASSYYQELSRS